MFLAIVERLKEPSSWAGIALLLSIFAPQLGGDAISAIVNAAAALCAALAILVKEKTPTE